MVAKQQLWIFGLGLGLSGCYAGAGESEPHDGGLQTDGGGGHPDSNDDSNDHPAATCEDVDPSTVVLHRLNRTEYDNTLRDLLGVDLKLSANFPAETHVEGFDNNAKALTISPLHMEKYMAAAKEVSALVLSDTWTGPQILSCTPTAGQTVECADSIIRPLLSRAYRRPVSDDEVVGMVDVVEFAISEGGSFKEGIGLALQSMLVSPHFLYRPEPPAEGDSEGVYTLPPYALASRLSYMLWSSMPDDELFAAAESADLSNHDTIAQQVTRMLEDPKASAFTRNFVGQWLHARALAEVHPSGEQFADFDESLRSSMEEEAYRFFDEVLHGDRPASDLLLADFVVIDRRLADHYGLPSDGLSDGAFSIVEVDPEQRGGLLRQGSFLTVTSHPTRTSPVKRGKWVLEQLLCSVTPAPPPGVEQLPQDIDPNATQREIFEIHRADPSCAGCHVSMDPIGFGLEHYDAIGTWRTQENGRPIDTTGELLGVPFTDARQLGEIIAADERFAPCVTRKVFTYALGRAPEDADQCTIDAIAEEFRARDQNLIELLVLIAQSPAATRRNAKD